MNVRNQLAVSAIAGAALLASAIAPVSIFGVTAQAQSTIGHGAAGTKRGDGASKAGPPVRANPPAIRHAPQPNTAARPVRSEPARGNLQKRIIVRDGDRRGGDGDRRRGTRHLWGPGIAFYFYDGFYHGDCSWLRRKARETGSSYWRQRYAKCRDE